MIGAAIPLGATTHETPEDRRRWLLVAHLLPFADAALSFEDLGADMRADLEAKRTRWQAELVELEEAKNTRQPCARTVSVLD